jgi:hypothetical protein
MNIRHLLRLRRWADRPPSVARMKLLAAVVAISAAIYALDHFGVWPEWASTENTRIKRYSD